MEHFQANNDQSISARSGMSLSSAFPKYRLNFLELQQYGSVDQKTGRRLIYQRKGNIDPPI